VEKDTSVVSADEIICFVDELELKSKDLETSVSSVVNTSELEKVVVSGIVGLLI